MTPPIIRAKKYHGMADLGLSRYVTLYVTQIGWVLLGLWFMRNAYWPSTCTPQPVHKIFAWIYEVYSCSPRLPENRHFTEAALFTWLWTTPILILLDVSRRYRAWMEKRQR
jgi:hypothetical protein